MYLTDYIERGCDESIPSIALDTTTYKAYYKYWREMLFQRVMHLFQWDGLGEVKQKEIEFRLLLSGFCAVCRVPSAFNAPFTETLTAMWASMFGVTKYADEFKQVNVRCPIWTGIKTIGEDVVIIDNVQTRNPLIIVVNHYAQMLAHNEVTIISTLINARDAGGVPTASTEKQKQSLRTYFKNLYNGKHDIVTDVANLNVEFIGTDRHTMQNIKDLFETRSSIVKAFYGDIGIKSAFEKNNNTVAIEVLSDTSQLIFNLSDMLDCRKRGAEAVNEMFGTNWTVKISDEINYKEMEVETSEREDKTGNGAGNIQTGTE